MTFPWITKLVLNKNLELHGWWFDLENSSLWDLNHKNKTFERLVPK
jgi:carbonic anhydrase